MSVDPVYYECIIPRLDNDHGTVFIYVVSNDITNAEKSIRDYYEKNLRETYGEFTEKVFETNPSYFWNAFVMWNTFGGDRRVIFGCPIAWN